MILFFCAVLTAGVIIAVTRPLSRAGNATPDINPDVEAFKARLSELDREQERETLSRNEAEQLRIERSRRMLRANRQSQSLAGKGSIARLPVNTIFIVLAAFIAVLSFSLYMTFGAFDLPDQPLADRLAIPVEKQSIEIQVAKVERALRKNPKDAAGWTVIAPVYLRLGKFEKAADAYRRAMLLQARAKTSCLASRKR